MYDDVVDVILRNGRDFPHRPALIDEAGGWDYSRLCGAAQRVAAGLRAAGVAVGDTVLVHGRRQPETVATLLGTMLAGAAYLAVEGAPPQARLARMLSQASPRVVVADDPGLFADSTVECLTLRELLDRRPAVTAPAPASATANAPAYVVFTSGTTGLPKAVVIGRRSLSWHASAVAEVFGLVPDDRVLQAASLNFDVSAEEIWPTLAAGAAVRFLPNLLGATGYAGLDAVLAKDGVTVCNLPSSYFAGWEAHLNETGVVPGTLRLVVTGSEVLPLESARRWVAEPSRPRLVNGYGVSEATITSLTCDVRPQTLTGDRVPLGSPLPGVEAVVADEEGRPVPTGTVGQLVLAGPGVAADRYWTGDLVHEEAGLFYFHGRSDDQLKINGVRAEPAEIESALLTAATADDSRVLMVGERVIGCVRSSRPVDEGLVRARMLDLLPAQLIPGDIVALESFPVTPGGKVDIPALRERAIAAVEAAAVRQVGSGDMSAVLRRLWGELLDAPDVHDGSDFFALGGNSLAAARLVNGVRRETGVACSLGTVFTHSRLQELAEWLNDQRLQKHA